MLEMGAVPRRERERQAVALDLHLKEEWTSAPIDARAHGRDLSISADDAGVDKPARAGDRRQIGSVTGMRLLHPGFTVTLVIDYHDGEVVRALRTDGGETPQPHQHLAISGDDEHATLGLRERKTQTDHARRPHRAPQWEGERMIARGGAIPRRRSEPGDNE